MKKILILISVVVLYFAAVSTIQHWDVIAGIGVPTDAAKSVGIYFDKADSGKCYSYDAINDIWITCKGSSTEYNVDPVDFGAIPNDSIYDSNAFQDAINYADTAGIGIVKPSPGEYYIIDVDAKSDLTFDLTGVKLIGEGVNTKNMINVVGEETGVVDSTRSVPSYSTNNFNDGLNFRVRVYNPSSWNVGDEVFIEHEERDAGNNIVGLDSILFSVVEDIVNDTLVLDAMLHYEFPLKTKITGINTVKNVTIQGGDFDGSCGHDCITGGAKAAIYTKWAKNVKIQNVNSKRQYFGVVEARYSTGLNISDIYSDNNRLFGIRIDKVTDVNAVNMIIQGNGQGGIILSSVKQGNFQNFTVRNCGKFNGSGDNVHVSLCENITISNATLYASNCYQIWTKSWSKNVILNAIHSYRGTTGGFYATQGVKNFTISNSILDDSIIIGDAISDPVKNVIIANNQVTSTPELQCCYGLLVRYVDEVKISNNIIHNWRVLVGATTTNMTMIGNKLGLQFVNSSTDPNNIIEHNN